LRLEPASQGVAADLEATSDAAHHPRWRGYPARVPGAFLVSGQHLLLEGLGVPALRRLGKGGLTPFAAVTLIAGLGAPVPDDVLTVAVRAGDYLGASNHDSSLPEQQQENHYPIYGMCFLAGGTA
jgi:hypothetical protein